MSIYSKSQHVLKDHNIDWNYNMWSPRMWMVNLHTSRHKVGDWEAYLPNMHLCCLYPKNTFHFVSLHWSMGELCLYVECRDIQSWNQSKNNWMEHVIDKSIYMLTEFMSFHLVLSVYIQLMNTVPEGLRDSTLCLYIHNISPYLTQLDNSRWWPMGRVSNHKAR